LTDSATNFLLEKSSSFVDLLAKHNYMRKRYSIQEVFRRIFSGFSAILNVLQSCEVFANFCANYFAKKFLLQKFFYKCAQMCAKKMCAKFLCDYVQNYFCKLFGIAFILQFSPFSFYKLLMLLWNSFANS
jgi:hypothetical protein